LARFAARFAYLGFTVAPETTELMQKMVENGEVDALVSERVWKEMQSALCEPNPEVFFEVLNSCGALKKLLPGLHDFTALKASVKLSSDPIIRFATLNFQACKHLKVPTEYYDLARLVDEYHRVFHEAFNLSAEQLLTLLEHLDLFRRPERLEPFLMACHAKYSGNDSTQSGRIRAAYTAASSVNTAKIAQGLTGIAIKQAIHAARIEEIRRITDK